MGTWSGLIVVAAIFFALIVGSIISSSYKEKKLIQQGVLPEADKTTDDDILRLVSEGHTIWAIKRYRQLHNVSLKEAKQKLNV